MKKQTTGQNSLEKISKLQCIIAVRNIYSRGWECIVFEDKHEFVSYMSNKYDFEFENGDRDYFNNLMHGELPDELEDLLKKHTYVCAWSFGGGDYEFSEDHEDVNEFEILKSYFLTLDGESTMFGDIFTIKEALENTDVKYNSILCDALMAMLNEGIDFEYSSEKYINVQ